MGLKIWPPPQPVGHYNNDWIKELIEREWPEEATLWDKRRRCDTLCKSPDAEDWQCGCLGPGGRYCHRLRSHKGKCSDLLNMEDRKSITQRLQALNKAEFDEIVGKTPTDSSRKLNARQLRKALRDG